MQGSRYRLVWIRQVDDVLQWRLVGTGKALMKPDVFSLLPARFLAGASLTLLGIFVWWPEASDMNRLRGNRGT